jgi:hypothetical protein
MIVKEQICGKLWFLSRWDRVGAKAMDAALQVWYGPDILNGHKPGGCSDNNCSCFERGFEAAQESVGDWCEPSRDEGRD